MRRREAEKGDADEVCTIQLVVVEEEEAAEEEDDVDASGGDGGDAMPSKSNETGCGDEEKDDNDHDGCSFAG